MNFLYLLDLLPRSINFKIKKNKIKFFYNVDTMTLSVITTWKIYWKNLAAFVLFSLTL